VKITKDDLGKRILFCPHVPTDDSCGILRHELYDAIIILVSEQGHVKLSYKNTMGGNPIWINASALDNWHIVEYLPPLSVLEISNI
jgi:hypothetical protein